MVAVTAADRFLEHAAVVAGDTAWLLSRILVSPDVAKVVANPPRWCDRAELAATVAAIHRAARASRELAQREDADQTDAEAPESGTGWSVKHSAGYLGLSVRRVQELAPTELGGRLVGGVWVLDEQAVRECGRRRRGVWREELRAGRKSGLRAVGPEGSIARDELARIGK